MFVSPKVFKVCMSVSIVDTEDVGYYIFCFTLCSDYIYIEWEFMYKTIFGLCQCSITYYLANFPDERINILHS